VPTVGATFWLSMRSWTLMQSLYWLAALQAFITMLNVLGSGTSRCARQQHHHHHTGNRF